MTTVSVVIPCFNHGRFVAECVASLAAQTMDDWRAIVVDDASNDGTTPAMCDAVASNRVEVVHLEQNLGRSLARNAGVARCETEAVLSLDADDALEPTHLEKTVPALLADPKCAIVYTDYARFGTRSGVMKAEPFDANRLYRVQYVFAGSLFRKSAFDACGGYGEAFGIGNEDWDLWLKIVEAGYVGRYVEEPLYRYRYHPESWTAQPAAALADQVLASRRLLRDRHLAHFERAGVLREFDYDTWMADARLRLRAGDLSAARQSFARAASIGPSSWRARWGWVKTLVR